LPKTTFRESQLFKAIVISINLNALMILLGVVGNAVKSLSILAKISNGMAAPTGFLLGWLIHPRTHSLAAIAFAAVEGMIGSIALYTLVAWVILRWVAYRRQSKSSAAQA
jgi:uncharacterized membrane protein